MSNLVLPNGAPASLRRTKRNTTTIGGMQVSYIMDTDLIDGLTPDQVVRQTPQGPSIALDAICAKINECIALNHALVREVISLREFLEAASVEEPTNKSKSSTPPAIIP